jgi:hypothetical protein
MAASHWTRPRRGGDRSTNGEIGTPIRTALVKVLGADPFLPTHCYELQTASGTGVSHVKEMMIIVLIANPRMEVGVRKIVRGKSKLNNMMVHTSEDP